jgi:hypothetical protein
MTDRAVKLVLYLVLAYVSITLCGLAALGWRFLVVPFLDALDAGAPWAVIVTLTLLLGTLLLMLREI